LLTGRGRTALKNLRWLRGPDYDSTSELDDIQKNLDAGMNDAVFRQGRIHSAKCWVRER